MTVLTCVCTDGKQEGRSNCQYIVYIYIYIQSCTDKALWLLFVVGQDTFLSTFNYVRAYNNDNINIYIIIFTNTFCFISVKIDLDIEEVACIFT